MNRTVGICCIGAGVLVAVPLVPDFAVLIGLSWLVLFGMHGLGCLLRR